jgi:hypothetical protein
MEAVRDNLTLRIVPWRYRYERVKQVNSTPPRKPGPSEATRRKHEEIWSFVQKRQAIAQREFKAGERDTDEETQRDLLADIREHFEGKYEKGYPSERTLRKIIRDGESSHKN